MKLLAILPLGFAGFCIAAAVDCWHDFFFPEFRDMRIETFGVAWLTSAGALGALVLTFLMVKYIPWEVKWKNIFP